MQHKQHSCDYFVTSSIFRWSKKKKKQEEKLCRFFTESEKCSANVDVSVQPADDADLVGSFRGKIDESEIFVGFGRKATRHITYRNNRRSSRRLGVDYGSEFDDQQWVTARQRPTELAEEEVEEEELRTPKVWYVVNRKIGVRRGVCKLSWGWKQCDGRYRSVEKCASSGVVMALTVAAAFRTGQQWWWRWRRRLEFWLISHNGTVRETLT